MVGDFRGGANPDILVTNSGSNDVAMLPGVGGVFFNDQSPQTFSVGNDPVTSFVGNYNGSTDLLTVNAGSNDLTMISDFNGADAVTSTVASGGVDPETAFAFSTDNGFDDLVVGNSGDGVLALFEGGENGLAMTSATTEPSLPSPSDLAFATLSGGQVEFYAATAGHEAATLVALSLGGETLAETETETSTATVNNVAQLVPLNESSLALVASILTLTVSTSEAENSLESAQSEAAVSVASLSGSSASLGQSVGRQSGRDLDPGSEVEKAGESAGIANPGAAAASPWARFMLGLDQALEQFRSEFQSRIRGAQDQATEREHPNAKPSADSTAPGAHHEPSVDPRRTADRLRRYLHGACSAGPKRRGRRREHRFDLERRRTHGRAGAFLAELADPTDDSGWSLVPAIRTRPSAFFCSGKTARRLERNCCEGWARRAVRAVVAPSRGDNTLGLDAGWPAAAGATEFWRTLFAIPTA